MFREWGGLLMRVQGKRSLSVGVTAVTLVLAACGGGGAPELSKASYIAKGSAVCAESRQRIESATASAFSEQGSIPSAEEITAFATKTIVPTIQREVDRLRDLKPPSDDSDRADDMLKAGQDGVDQVREDPTIILSGSKSFERYRELSSAYGLKDCGDNSPTVRDAISGISKK
ncbi:MAG: hypothetical protein ACR2G7_07980 [Acidimicrobiales bacterium]